MGCKRTVGKNFQPGSHDLGRPRKLVGGVKTRGAPPEEHDECRPQNAEPDSPGDGSVHRNFPAVAFLAK